MMYLCRCTRGNVCAGMVVEEGRVTEAAPILRSAGVIVGGPGRAAVEGLRINRWRVEFLPQESAEQYAERVAICAIDGGMDEEGAHRVALTDQGIDQ